MKVSLRALTALALLFTASCTTTKAGPPPPAPPVIKSFSADKTMVSSGTAVKLTFTTADAKEVSLIDQSGTEVPVTGSVEMGEATVTPTRSSFYVLRVTGEGGRDSAFVQVAVNEGLKQVFLIAVPTEISSGETVELVWSALGGSNISVKDSSGMTLSTDESGTKSAQPEKTTTWTLRADGPTGTQSATARVTVRPAIKDFSATPPAARQGQKIKLQWRTAGADGVTLKEATFGDLVATATDVASGSYEFTVPTDFSGPTDGGSLADGGVFVARPVPDNFPLRFVLTAASNSPMQVVSAALDSIVHDGPIINTFDAPLAVSENKPFTLSWNATAFRAQILLNGVPVYATVPPALATGTLVLPGISADTTVTLVVYDYLGLKVSQTKVIKAVKPPKVVTFTLPASVSAAGSAANAMWTTTHATLVVLRVKNGPAVFTTSTATQVTAGTGTVNPADDTTYVLEAYNAAGDMDSLQKTVAVSTPATTSATPNPTSPNTTVQLDWDVSGLNPTEVIGIASEVVQVTPMSPAFVDLENVPGANKLYFSDRGEGTAAFTVPQGYKFPFITASFGTFTAGVNGFLALAPTNGSTLINNADLKAMTGLPTVPLIAPFWDNLDLGMNGEVSWMLEGTAFPRRLIVQWNKVNVGGDPTSNLTFQVQLFETGELRFIYKTLQDAAGAFAQGQSATVGVFAGATLFAGQHSYNTPALVEGQELTWFTQGAAIGMSTIKVGSTGVSPGFFYKTAGGGYVYVSIPVRVFGPNSLKINEAMPIPDAAAPMGQYVELFNPQPVDVDVSGLQLVGKVTPTPGYTLPAGTTIPAKGYLVLGQTVDALQNGEAPVTVAYGADVPFIGTADGVTLQIPGATPFVVSKLTWATAVAAESVQLETTVGTLTCTRTSKFGTTVMSVGTPGKENESCFPYTLEVILETYFDISATGTVIVTGDSAFGNFDLSSAPFSFFKMPRSSLKASTNGFILLDSTSADYANTNRILPSPTATNKGSIAPFWDDLDASALPFSSCYGQRIAAGADPANPGAHWIIQWNHVERWLNNDDLNIQIKLFDTGVIEYHYAAMVSGSASNYANGNGATVWLEDPTGNAALPISIEQPLIEPHTAYRFTPKP